MGFSLVPPRVSVSVSIALASTRLSVRAWQKVVRFLRLAKELLSNHPSIFLKSINHFFFEIVLKMPTGITKPQPFLPIPSGCIEEWSNPVKTSYLVQAFFLFRHIPVNPTQNRLTYPFWETARDRRLNQGVSGGRYPPDTMPEIVMRSCRDVKPCCYWFHRVF